jgi:hypothetical protein
MKNPLLLFIIALLSLVNTTTTYACDCVSWKLEQSIKFSNLVLIGKFVEGNKLWELSEISKDAPKLFYTGKFIVKRVLKGSSVKRGDTLQVKSDFTNCSSLYKNRADYVFFNDGGEVRSITCSYTRELGNGEGDKIHKQTKRLLRKRLLTTVSM